MFEYLLWLSVFYPYSCVDGYYGDPALNPQGGSSGIPCQPCMCPGGAQSNFQFADTCQLDIATQTVYCNCQPGYTGKLLLIYCITSTLIVIVTSQESDACSVFVLQAYLHATHLHLSFLFVRLGASKGHRHGKGVAFIFHMTSLPKCCWDRYYTYNVHSKKWKNISNDCLTAPTQIC